jgi:[ribosomal protein S18]-alanine N-acetyltransferase
MIAQTEIRYATYKELPSIVSLEETCFEFPWSEHDFIHYLRSHATLSLVVELDNEVIGYVVYSVEGDKMEILNLAVDPNFRRNGIGSEILATLREQADLTNRNKIVGYVRESNLAAQLFLRSSGFIATEIKREQYDETDEDCYLFEFFL